MVDKLLRKIGIGIIIAGALLGLLIGVFTRLPKEFAFLIPAVALMTGINIYRMPLLPKDYYTRSMRWGFKPPQPGDKYGTRIPESEETAVDADRLRADINASKKRLEGS